MDHIIQNKTMSTNVSEKAFDAILNNIKVEYNPLFNGESKDLEDFSSIDYNFIYSIDKKQRDEMCKLASTSSKMDVDVSESNLRELSDTELVDGKIVSVHISSPSTATPITQISPKLTPYTCLEHCFLCNDVFRILDTHSHIGQIRSIDKRNEFFKIEPSLSIDSCLCDSCWKDLEKTYKSIRIKRMKNEETFDEKKYRLLERWNVKKKGSRYRSQARRCSIYFCSKIYCHKMDMNEYESIEKILSMFEPCRLVFVKSKKQTLDFLKFPFCLCSDHKALILVMSSCQICSCILNEPFNTADWSMYETWNRVLFENNLPLTLQRGMFICMTCRGHISKSNPSFPTKDLQHLRDYITMSNTIRLKLYGESQHNLFNICQRSTYVTSPIVVPKIQEEKEFVCSLKVKFSNPLITEFYPYEVYYNEHDTKSITSTALLNVAEQNPVLPKLELPRKLTRRTDFISDIKISKNEEIN